MSSPSNKPKEFWVPEDHCFELAEDCLEAFPDAGPACLVSGVMKSYYEKAVETLKWYDGVHRQHWCINLDDIPKKAYDTLEELGELE